MCILMKIILKILLIINYSLIFANINLIKNIFKMKELIEKINAEFASFTTEANAQVEKGNKAAGTRASHCRSGRSRSQSAKCRNRICPKSRKQQRRPVGRFPRRPVRQPQTRQPRLGLRFGRFARQPGEQADHPQHYPQHHGCDPQCDKVKAT